MPLQCPGADERAAFILEGWTHVLRVFFAACIVFDCPVHSLAALWACLTCLGRASLGKNVPYLPVPGFFAGCLGRACQHLCTYLVVALSKRFGPCRACAVVGLGWC